MGRRGRDGLCGAWARGPRAHRILKVGAVSDMSCLEPPHVSAGEQPHLSRFSGHGPRAPPQERVGSVSECLTGPLPPLQRKQVPLYRLSGDEFVQGKQVNGKKW